MSRGGLLGLFALAVTLALPSSAIAVDRFVDDTGVDTPGCTNSAAPCKSIDYAADQATDGDTIRIAPGVYAERVQTDRVLTFVGAGAGSLDGVPAVTLVNPPVNDGFGLPAFDLPRGGTLRSLRAEGGDADSTTGPFGDSGGLGIDFDSAFPDPASLILEDVVAVGGSGGAGTEFQGTRGEGILVLGGPGPVSVRAVGSEFAGGPSGFSQGEAMTIRGEGASGVVLNSRMANGEIPWSAVHVGDNAELTLSEVDVEANDIGISLFDGRLAVRRSRIHSATYLSLHVSASSGDNPDAELVDSLLTSDGFGAASVDAEEEASASLKVFGSTLIARGGEAALVANPEEYGGAATVTIRNSVVRHLPAAPEPAVDLLAEKASSIDAAFSSYSTVEEKEGGTATPPGSAGNLAGDPHFIDEANGVYVLQNTSPLIDRGDPGVVQPGQLDLLGAPRSLDGNRDCVVAPDIGAFEVTGQGIECPVDPGPAVTGFGMTNKVFAPAGKRGGSRAGASAKKAKRGTRFLYTLSEPAKVTITIERRARGRKVRRAGKTRCIKPKPGNRKPRCTRFVRAGALTAQAESGKQSTPFSGRIRGKALKPGRYRATIVAIDSAGQSSAPQRLSFRIVKG